MEWIDGKKIQITPPRRPKKLIATRFAAILRLNPWSTPSEVWCEVTRTRQRPFKDTIYIVAGKIIEPKQAEYMKNTCFMSSLVTPTDIYGGNYSQKTFGGFFSDTPVLGGMWDYLLHGKDGKLTAVLEMKTSKRVEDRAEDIPEYYALQAALYVYLLGVGSVIMVTSFLEPGDYEHSENSVCSSSNTITRPFKVSEHYPDFEKRYVKPALKWWKDHVESGLSPAYSEKKDAETLSALHTNNFSSETDLEVLVKEAEELKGKLDAYAAEVSGDEKRYKTLTDMTKKATIRQFREGDKKVSIAGTAYTWEVGKSTTTKINKDVMKADGVLDKHNTTEDNYRLLPKAIKEG